jgi:hypothetical protein
MPLVRRAPMNWWGDTVVVFPGALTWSKLVVTGVVGVGDSSSIQY